MKLSQLKTIVKEAVKEAIQEELKDVLMEAVRSPKHQIYETKTPQPQYTEQTPGPMNPVATKSREEIRESYKNVLAGMVPGANDTLSANTNSMPLQVTSTDTASPNGSLPSGDVSMDQIMGLMNK
jgi:hypothetical protein